MAILEANKKPEPTPVEPFVEEVMDKDVTHTYMRKWCPSVTNVLSVSITEFSQLLLNVLT